MTKKNWLLFAIAIVLATVYAVYFTDWFKPKTVKIFHTSLNLPASLQRPGAMPPLIFGFSQPIRLTEIKVVPLAEWQADPHVLPLWHLVSDSNSAPMKMLHYGAHVTGMKPAVPGSRPQLLATNVAYRLFISAGKIKGQHDFELGGQLGQTNNPASN